MDLRVTKGLSGQSLPTPVRFRRVGLNQNLRRKAFLVFAKDRKCSMRAREHRISLARALLLLYTCSNAKLGRSRARA